MSVVPFDTLALARKLRDDAKMTQEQAEGIAKALGEAMTGADVATKADLAPLATRADLAEVEHRLETKIVDAKGALETRIESVKVDLMKWFVPMMLGQIAVIAALVKLL